MVWRGSEPLLNVALSRKPALARLLAADLRACSAQKYTVSPKISELGNPRNWEGHMADPRRACG